MFLPKISNAKTLKEIVVFEPSVNYDERGSIFTSFDKSIYNKYLPDDIDFIHDKFAESKNNVLRGLHGDNKTWKLISCVYGEIYQVVVDIRDNSKNKNKWESFELSSDNKKQILVPPGFVNGYYVKSEFTVFHYKLAYTGKYFDVKDQIVIKWDDKDLDIEWPCTNPILQSRDK